MDNAALVLVDIQNDFLPGGSLAVPEGDQVIPVANQLIGKFQHIFLTQDWHPADHGSFASMHSGKSPGETVNLNGLDQVLWPDHCVQGSFGAKFHSSLQAPAHSVVVQKGTDPEVDSYSGFFDNGRRQETPLRDLLNEKRVQNLVICGLATDYCVKFTALDAIDLGFQVTLVLSGCRGVNLNTGDVEKAINEMKTQGVNVVENFE